MARRRERREGRGIHTGLENTEEEPGREEAVVVLNEALENRGEAEHEHAD